MRGVRSFVISRLKTIPGLTVLEPESRGTASFEDSIVAFYLTNHPRSGDQFRRMLAKPRSGIEPEFDNLPITLPALIRADKRDYLRLSFDPARPLSDNQYLRKIDYVLRAIAECLSKLESLTAP